MYESMCVVNSNIYIPVIRDTHYTKDIWMVLVKFDKFFFYIPGFYTPDEAIKLTAFKSPTKIRK